MILNSGIIVWFVYAYALYCDVGSEWEPTLQPNLAPGRELATTALSRGNSLQPIRILFSYQNLNMNDDQENILKTRIMNSVKNWFTSVLLVYPLSSNLILKIQKCNNAIIPQDHLTVGVPYDYILYIYGNTTTASYLARGGACTYDSAGYGNVLAGSFEINIANFFKSSVEDAVITSIHEATHALVFSSSLYSQYVMPNGTKWTNPTTTVYSTNREKSITLLTLPTVTQKAQSAFNCNNLAGVELEDGGGTGSAGSHWDMRIMPHDYMSPSYAYYSVLSDITLALFQDSGWYNVNFTYAQSIIWGKNQGCAWTDNKCISNGVAQFPGFCTNLNSAGCDVFRIAESSCYQNSYSNIPSYEQYYSTRTIGGATLFLDYCTYMYPFSNRFCQKSSSSYNSNYYGETLGFNSRCVESTLLSKKYVYTAKYKGNCHTIINCTSTYANIQVGTQIVQCPFTGGNITVSGYNGFLVCPSSSILCNEIPCLNACQGNGICNKGICKCNPGYGGNDCSAACDSTCLTCSGIGPNNCASCYSTATLANGACNCPSGYTFDISALACISSIVCDYPCISCSSTTQFSCMGCSSGYYLFQQYCTQACPYGYIISNGSCQSSQPDIYKGILTNWNYISMSESSNISLVYGTSSTFMPTPDSLDPVLSYLRGAYFRSNSIIFLPPNIANSSVILLSPINTAELWIRPDNTYPDQTFLYKYSGDYLINFKITNSKIRLKILLTSTLNYTTSYSICDGLALSNKTWQYAAYLVAYSSSTQVTTVTLYLNSQTLSCTYPTSIFIDSANNGGFLVGIRYDGVAYSQGYQGFLASLDIKNKENYTPSYTGNTCIRSNYCLASCDYGQYPLSGNCWFCLTSCSYGCAQGYNCILNYNVLCVTPKDFVNCTTCVTGAFVNGGVCECTQNSVYNALTNTCDCVLGYQYINTYCAACANYFSPSEVYGYFSSDYLSIIIQFNRSVSSTTTSDCTKIFYKDGYNKLGSNPSCAWISSAILQVMLGKGFTILNETLPINPQNVLAAGNSCNWNIIGLSPQISFLYPYPSPIVSLQAPSTYSLTCSSTDLIISGDQSQYTYKYYWSASINPANSALTNLIASQTGSKFTIAKSNLTQSTLNITLTVANFFGASSTSTASIRVIQNNTLTVTIDSGSFVYIYQSKQSQYKIMVSDFCNYNEQATYSWSYISKSLGAPSLDVTSILSNSLLPYILLINSNQLSAGYSYMFNATVTEGSAIGWCTLLITVLQSDLKLILSQTSGVVYNGNTLSLDASKSFDPDNPSLLLNYTWNCYQDGSYCKNSVGSSLIVANTSSSSLSILGNNLVVNASYSFHVTIQEYSRNASGIIDITVANGSGSITISNPTNRINSQAIYTIYSTVSATDVPIFSWSQTAGPMVTASMAMNYSYISFPAYSLVQGSIYTYRVSMTYSSGSKIYSDITWTTDYGPTCSGVSASLNSDNSWLLWGNNCTGDSINYPLTYSFYITIDNYNYSLSTPSQSSYFKTNLPTGNWQIVLSVCSSFGTCNSYKTTVSVTSLRRLQSSSADSFNFSSKNPDEIPSSIIYYSLIKLDNSTFEEMIDKFETHILSQRLINSGILDTAISSIKVMLLHIENPNPTTIFITMNIIETILVNYNYTITDQQADAIIKLYSPYFSDYIYYYQFQSIFRTMAAKWLKSAVPGASKFNEQTCLFYLSRLFPQNLKGSTISISNRTITTPSTVLLDPSEVYDIAVAIFPLAGNFSDVVYIQFYTSGSYANYGLSLLDNPDESWISNSSYPVSMQISVKYNYTFHYQCSNLEANYSWTNDSCMLAEVNNYSAVVDVFHASTFQIDIIKQKPVIDANYGCGIGHGPFIAMGIIIFTGILGVCIFSLLDQEEKSNDTKNSSQFWENWALTSLFIHQNSYHRVQMILQVMSIFLFELFLCGAFYRVFDDPYEPSNQSFEDYSEEELKKVLLSLVIGQSLAIVLTMLNSAPFCDSKPRIISSSISSIVSLGSVLGIIMLSYTFCSKYSDFWIIDFLIDIPIDLLIFQPLWSILSIAFSRLMKNRKSFEDPYSKEETVHIDKGFDDDQPKID